jgi:pimeloyl-ACP methyl ester carboxylesterase
VSGPARGGSTLSLAPSADPTKPQRTTGTSGRTSAPALRGRRLRVALGLVGVVLLALVAFAGFLLVKPVDVPRTVGAALPTTSFAEATALFNAVAQREQAGTLLPAYRSKLITHGAKMARVIVLFHGYTNCPAMFEMLGEQLAAEGFNVYIPLAPAHGEADREHSSLASLTTEGLIAYGNESVDIATGLGDEVTVLGLSGGGAVATYLAQYRDDVDLAIPVAPFLGLRAVPGGLTPAVVNLADLLPSISWGIPEAMATKSGDYAPYASLDNNSKSAAADMRLGQMVLADAALHPHRAGRTVNVINEVDDTVNNGLVDDLTARWRRLAPDAATDYHFAASLGLPHDLIGPDRSDQRTSEVYPVLLDLVGRP